MADPMVPNVRFIFVLLLLLALAACGQEDALDDGQQPTPDGSSSPTSGEPIAAESSPEPVETTGPQTVATSAVTPEPSPTSTPTVEPSPSPTLTPTVEPSPSATSPPPVVAATSVQLKMITSGFARPTYLTHASDERLFVVEQSGLIHIIDRGDLLPEPFLDIRDRVGSDALEQGLLSVAFHPSYADNGQFFVYYTNKAGDAVVARYQVSPVDPDQAGSDSETIIMTIAQPYANHNGGQLQFGPDGYLYVGTGDGGSRGDPANNGQNGQTLLGALLRLDVDGAEPYLIPGDNPFLGTAAALDEIWATGLRNPWRFSFDRSTGDLFIADVGQNIWEEINFQPAASPGGENYGWNVLEANECYASENCDRTRYVAPVAEYSHADGHCSVTGGYVYRGRLFPQLVGNYFFADYCSGVIWSLVQQPDGNWLQNVVQASQLNVSSFGEDAGGELYVLDHVGGGIYQIQP